MNNRAAGVTRRAYFVALTEATDWERITCVRDVSGHLLTSRDVSLQSPLFLLYEAGVNVRMCSYDAIDAVRTVVCSRAAESGAQ